MMHECQHSPLYSWFQGLQDLTYWETLGGLTGWETSTLFSSIICSLPDSQLFAWSRSSPGLYRQNSSGQLVSTSGSSSGIGGGGGKKAGGLINLERAYLLGCLGLEASSFRMANSLFTHRIES